MLTLCTLIATNKVPFDLFIVNYDEAKCCVPKALLLIQSIFYSAFYRRTDIIVFTFVATETRVTRHVVVYFLFIIFCDFNDCSRLPF